MWNKNIRRISLFQAKVRWKTSLETSKFSIYFQGSCIPTNESLFILLALPTPTQTVPYNVEQCKLQYLQDFRLVKTMFLQSHKYTTEPEITAGGFPTKFRFFRPNAEMIGNFVRPNFEKKKNVFLMIGLYNA